MSQPVVLTCGDPNGVGIDLTLQIAKEGIELPFFAHGDIAHFHARGSGIDLIEIADVSEFRKPNKGELFVLQHVFSASPTLDGIQAENAKDTIKVIEQAVNLVQSGHASALCTNPINKAALIKGAGFQFPGHTEFLAHLAGVEMSVMMLANSTLRAVPVTIHNALSEVPERLSKELIERTIRILHQSLITQFKIRTPRIAVAGLNPHAGENGEFGLEEIELINPVLKKLRSEGLQISGALSADTMFHEEARLEYDAAVCMYHDQALIPVKALDFHGGVNITLGLPFIRTSPDHGTAYSLAGTNKGNSKSLRNALMAAYEMAKSNV